MNLFDIALEAEEYVPDHSMDKINNEIFRASLDELITNGEINNLAMEAIDKLLWSLEKDTSDDRDIHDSYEELLELYKSTGYISYNPTQYSTEELEEMSLEKLIDDKKGLLSTLINKFTSALGEEISGIASLPKLFSQYDSEKLKILKSKIENGTMVPRASVSTSAKIGLNKKFGVMYAHGYDVTKNTDGLIEYMDSQVKRVVDDKFYKEVLADVQTVLLGFKEKKELKVDKNSTKMLKNLKIKYDLDIRDKTIYFSLIIRMFAEKLSIVSLSALKKEKDTKSTLSKIFDNTHPVIHTDTISVKDRVKPIVPLPPKEVIKLLDYGIKGEKRIGKAVSMVKRDYGNNLLRKILDYVASKLLSIVPILPLLYSIRVGRFSNNVANHLLILLRDMINYDKLIIQYINATYEIKK